MDTTHLSGFQRIAEAAVEIGGTPMGLIGFIDADRQWIRASVGVPFGEIDRASTFCSWTVYNADVLWVNDARHDPRFFDHPLVEDDLCIRHYAGVPVTTPRGYVLGTLCVIDTEPRPFNAEVVPKLVALAAEVSKMLYEAVPAEPRRDKQLA
jgi:GAF domain-containing protein